MPDKKTRVFMHSWHQKENDINVIGVKEKIITEHEDGTTDIKPHLRLLKDPKRPFWVTKRQFQNHAYKKEYEDLDKCDEYICRDSELTIACQRALGMYPSKFKPLPIICRSPYLYGADISTETLVKQKYLADAKGAHVPVTIGGLDIETEVNDQERIIAITYIHENLIFTACLEEFVKIYENKQFVRNGTLKDLEDTAHQLLDPILKPNNFTFTIHISKTEVGVIKWIFDRINECKSDYISVWNMGYDIPYIINRLELLGIDPKTVMCAPELPDEYKYVKWIEDKSVVAHFTDKWHWLNLASYSQFIDTMCLYARLRKVYGRDSSYSLDAISDKELGMHKLHFGNITNHYVAQHFDFLKYVAYNMNDVILLILMERKNHDIESMCGLADVTLIREYSRQQTLVKNNAYMFYKEKGIVFDTVSDDMYTKYDRMLAKVGGTVLPLDKAVGLSKPILKDSESPSMFIIHVNDLDISSSYPSVISSMNISKETCLATIIKINGFNAVDVEPYCTAIVNPKSHANLAVPYFFNMPTYEEMDKLYCEHRKEIGLDK